MAAQDLAEDTVYFDFNPEMSSRNLPSVNKIEDTRDEPDSWLSTGSRKKYLLIPLDVLYCNREPLGTSLQRGFPGPDSGSPCYDLEIRDLSLIYRKGKLFPAYVFSATIPVYKIEQGVRVFEGSLFYNNDYKKLRREKQDSACSRILNLWYPRFQEDLLSLESGHINSGRIYWVENSVPGPEKLNLLVSAAAGFNWWQTEAEVWFSGMETVRKWVYTTSILRYQNQKEYESIAFGRGIEHLSYRICPPVSYDGSFSFLIGINKWKHLREEKPTIYQIPGLSISSVQSLVFSNPGSGGFSLKAGVVGNLYYIYDKDPGFQAGIYLGIAYEY